MNVVLSLSSFTILIWFYLKNSYMKEHVEFLAALSTSILIFGNRKSLFRLAPFKSLKSIHTLTLSPFFETATIFFTHWGYSTTLKNPASYYLCTLFFFTFIRISNFILLNSCFIGLQFKMNGSLCIMISVSNPSMSK